MMPIRILVKIVFFVQFVLYNAKMIKPYKKVKSVISILSKKRTGAGSGINKGHSSDNTNADPSGSGAANLWLYCTSAHMHNCTCIHTAHMHNCTCIYTAAPSITRTLPRNSTFAFMQLCVGPFFGVRDKETSHTYTAPRQSADRLIGRKGKREREAERKRNDKPNAKERQ